MRAAAVAAVLIPLVVLGVPSQALAHSVLESSDPADGSSITAAPRTMTFTFFEPIQQDDPAVALRTPNGHSVAADSVRVQANQLIGTFSGAFEVGQYTVEYRYTSLDGDPGRGEIRFTLEQPSPAEEAVSAPTDAATPTPEAATSTTAALSETAVAEPAADPEPRRGLPTTAVIIGSVAVVAFASAVALSIVRRRGRRG
ncbi:copper resistance CopC family protein [Rhodococcoides fascians]|uniref:copper resistance CopC family protein n=1 Tax=Rhodococcoides fascians TaxID=1828 RepID=UPI00050CE690|nr:copper resistance protein CopC [Rhodococcus fascians]